MATHASRKNRSRFRLNDSLVPGSLVRGHAVLAAPALRIVVVHHIDWVALGGETELLITLGIGVLG